MAAAAVAALAVTALAGCGGSPKQGHQTPPTPEETAYLQNIQVTPGRVEAAKNFLDHTVTTVYGTLTNNGSKTVVHVEISLSFSDIEGKPIEKKTASPVSVNTTPLGPGESRPFQVSFDRVPAMWNQAPPGMVPTRVVLAAE